MPARLIALSVAAVLVSTPSVRAEPTAFDVVAHQGGPAGSGTGESLAAFATALELGVSTLELDIGITKDRQPVVWHDESMDATKCRDTTPATAGDPRYPYSGELIHQLTLAQVRTLNCGNHIAVLSEVFELVDKYRADVRFDIETKVDAEQPDRTADPQTFVDVILAAVRAAGALDRVDIESFDWRTLSLVHRVEPSIPLAALWDRHTWSPGSPWLAGFEPAAGGGDPVTGAGAVGATILSPEYSLVDRTLVQRAHAASLTVLPWTVDDAGDMRTQIEYGVDGIITNYPAVLRDVLAARGMPLPRAFRRN